MNLENINIMSNTAVYVQIKRLIQFAIASGKLKPGDKLPGNEALTKQLKVSISTVIKAYEDLRTMGLITSRRRTGAHVAKDARKKCRDRCYTEIVSRLHEVTQEAKAAGKSGAHIREVIGKSFAADMGPYDETPAGVLALARKK